MSLLLLALLCSLKLYSQTNDLKTDFSNFELLIKEGKIKEAWANGEAYLAQIPKNNRLQQAETNYLLGKIAHKQKEDSLANIFLGSAAALLDNNCESECVLFARTHDLLGVSFYRAGNYVKSRLHLEQALRVWLSFPLIDSLSTANTMLNLGKTVRYLDEFTRAIELFGQARAMGERFQKQGFKVMLTYMFTGNVHYLRDQYAEAEAAYSKALEIERSAPVMRPRAVIALTNNLAATLDLRGRLKQAIDRYQEVLLLSKELYGPNDVRTISIYSNIGLVYQRMKNGGMAERYYAQACSRAEKALGADHPVTAQVFEEYASLAWNNGDSKLALERAQIALYASAPTISRKDYHENPALKDVINLEQFRSTIEFKGRILFHTADTTANPQAQLQFALACYELYMEAMDQVWQGFSDPGDKVYLNQNGLNAYEEAIRCAAKLFQLTKDSRYQEKIFDYMERGKFQVMLESIQRSRAAYLAGIPLDLRKQTEALRELVNTLGFRLRQKNQSSDSSTSLRNELLEVQLKLSHLTDSLKSAFPAFEQMTGQRSRLSFTTLVDQYTNAEMALIEYFLADSSLFVMTGHPSGVQFREVKLKPGFRDSLLSFAGLLQSPDPGRAQLLHYQQLAFSLYQTLIAPELMALPKSVKRLRIIPDDLLSLLPFDALLSDSSPENPRNHGELPFLIYKYQVSYAASAALLSSIKPQNPGPVTCLGFAWNASNDSQESSSRTINGSNWPGLPGTVREISAIKSQVQGQFFLGQDASEARFKNLAPEYGLLHLALHGNSAGEEPFILFPEPGDSVEDGVLYLHELYNLPLKARLAFLSACETGTGTIAQGEGVMSVATGFASAGCPSILMSVWPIDDIAGSKITRRFYKELVAGKPLDISLHTAKLAFLKSANSFNTAPFYWAPFILLGEVSPVEVAQNTSYLPIFLVFAGSLLIILTWILLRMRKSKRKIREND